jgi:hypothetical protein
MRNEEQTYRDGMQKLLEEIRDDGKETKLQAKMTNGRVNKLENWRWFITGGLTLITVLLLPLLFILIQKLV